MKLRPWETFFYAAAGLGLALVVVFVYHWQG